MFRFFTNILLTRISYSLLLIDLSSFKHAFTGSEWRKVCLKILIEVLVLILFIVEIDIEKKLADF